MGNGLLVYKQNQVQDGLDRLVNGGPDKLQDFDGALAQLEHDDSFDAHTADRLVELILQMQELSETGQSTAALFAQIKSVYNAAKVDTVEARWRVRSGLLSDEELDTDLWYDLYDAVEALEEGDRESTLAWSQEVFTQFMGVWQDYESNTPVFDEEITQESILGHKFLKEGLAFWLEALQELQSVSPDLDQVWEKAENGQRLLVAVQILEEELSNLKQRYFVNWN